MRKLLPLLALTLVLTSCWSDQTRAAYGGNVTVDPLPVDTCYLGGVPQIHSVSIEEDNDIDFTYLSTNGDVVSQKFTRRGFNVETTATGKLIWERRLDRPKPKCDPTS